MLAKAFFRDERIIYNFEAQADDKIDLGKAKFSENSCYVKLPAGVDSSSIHPDLYALSVILIVFPFLGSRLDLDRAVSKHFAEEFERITKRKIGPVDTSIEPRRAPAGSKPALAFSGGVDSTAALTLMPKDTVSIFLDRPLPENKRTMYKKEAVKFACDSLRDRGFNVHEVESNLEYVRDPVGFPVDFSNSVPAVVLADHMSLDSIAFGMIMESSYRVGHEFFMDYAHRSHYRLWSTLFEAAGFPLNLVTAGISEVGTSSIVIKSEIGDIAQSCMRGDVKKPCFNCWKCFRKVLLDATLKNKVLDNEVLDKAFDIKEAKVFLGKDLIKHQNVIEYIGYNYTGSHESMLAMTEKVSNNGDVSFLRKWYPKSKSLMFEKYRDSIEQEIQKYLEVMDDEEQDLLESYDLRRTLESDFYRVKSDKFGQLLKS